jgi:hypothetical protein
MNARKLSLRLAALALVATTMSLSFFEGCGGGSNSNPTPTKRDSGPDSTNPPDTGGKTDTGGGGDSGNDAGADVGLPDTGSCKSEASTCNTCYTDAQAATDPYNACSPYTANCHQFTTTVPTHPTL